VFFGILLSAHLGFEQSYNSIHPHVGIALSDAWSIGAYYNSEYRVSTYIVNTLSLSDNSSIDIGLVTGYEFAELQPMIKFNYKRIFIAPAAETLDSHTNVGLVVGLEWRY
jgi:hypothetical protein